MPSLGMSELHDTDSELPVIDRDPSGLASPPANPRNIMIISSIFYPHVFGGAEIAAYNRAKLLVKRGHKVSIVTLQEESLPPSWGEFAPEGFRVYRIKAPRQHTLFDRTRFHSAAAKLFWHLQDYFDVRNRGLIRNVLDHVKPDYIEIDNIIGIGFNALSEIGRLNIPVTYILHDSNLACFNTGMIRKGESCKRQCVSCRGIASLRQGPLKNIKRLGFVSPSRANLERARKFVPALDRSLSCVIRNVPEEMPPLQERKPSKTMRLLYVGRIDPVKGLDFLLHTLEPLSDHYDFKITILGTGPSEARLKQEFAEKSWVEFRGFVSGEEVAACLMQSDIYCIPSLVEESYGLVTARALQLGTPVIGSNRGGTAELVRDGVTGILVPPGDAQSWRSAFLKIFTHPDLLGTWRENATRFSAEFDQDVIAQAYEEFITRLSSRSDKSAEKV